MRYALDKEFMHACRDSFLRGAQEWDIELQARHHAQHQLLHECPGHARWRTHLRRRHFRAGRYVEMRAEMDVICLISNCPQLNNPCNGYNPTPVEVLIWD